MTDATLSDLPKELHALPRITIYGPTICPKCKQAMNQFDSKNLAYTKIDIEPGDSNYTFITKKLGAQSAPVIVVEFDDEHSIHWSDHRMDMLMGLTRLCAKPLVPKTDSNADGASTEKEAS